jgi:hypothetical protein
MKKITAILFAALLTVVPLSAQATGEQPTISISSYEEWLAAGVQNGWVVDNQIVQRKVEQPAPAAEPVATEEIKRVTEKALVIVDSYFDLSKISGDVVSVCVARSGCELTPTPVAGVSSAYNHGTAMAEVALKQNPNIKLVLVRAASVTKNVRTGVVSISTLNGNDFLKSLSYVSSRSDVGAVSFSYNLSGNKACSLSTTGGVNLRVVEPQIRSTISSLKANGVPVFSSTGNKAGAAVNYPACIADVNSVGVGDLNKMGNVASVFTFDTTTDYFATGSVSNYKSNIFGLIPNTTSAGNVAVATKYLSGTLDNKFVNVLN